MRLTDYRKDRIKREMTVLHDEKFLIELSKVGELFPVESQFLIEYMDREEKNPYYLRSLLFSGMYTSPVDDVNQNDEFSNFRGK